MTPEKNYKGDVQALQVSACASKHYRSCFGILWYGVVFYGYHVIGWYGPCHAMCRMVLCVMDNPNFNGELCKL